MLCATTINVFRFVHGKIASICLREIERGLADFHPKPDPVVSLRQTLGDVVGDYGIPRFGWSDLYRWTSTWLGGVGKASWSPPLSVSLVLSIFCAALGALRNDEFHREPFSCRDLFFRAFNALLSTLLLSVLSLQSLLSPLLVHM